MTNTVKSWLRNLKRRFEPKDGSVGYRRRLERELARVDRTFAGDATPVLIQTYGKVGSTAIHAAIGKLPGFGSFQTHFISEEGVQQARGVHEEHDRDPIHLKVGDRLREKLAEQPDRPVKIVTLVREPVSRAVSNLFENPNLLVDGANLRELPLERIIGIAAEQVLSSMHYTERWFDRELCGLFGIDFFGQPFDKEGGFTTLEKGRYQLLAGKLELLSKNGEARLGEFLGLDGDLPIERRRARSSTGEASLYDQVREKLTLPAELLDQAYSSRVCQHFYTEEEIAGFRGNWE